MSFSGHHLRQTICCCSAIQICYFALRAFDSCSTICKMTSRSRRLGGKFVASQDLGCIENHCRAGTDHRLGSATLHHFFDRKLCFGHPGEFSQSNYTPRINSETVTPNPSESRRGVALRFRRCSGRSLGSRDSVTGAALAYRHVWRSLRSLSRIWDNSLILTPFSSHGSLVRKAF